LEQENEQGAGFIPAVGAVLLVDVHLFPAKCSSQETCEKTECSYASASRSVFRLFGHLERVVDFDAEDRTVLSGWYGRTLVVRPGDLSYSDSV
jgi:hypothetical protein